MRAPLLIAALFICLAGAACKKAKPPSNPGSVQPINPDIAVAMGATINNAGWKADSANGYLVKSSANDSTVNLMVTATRKAGDSVTTIVLYVTNFTGNKTYPIDAPDVNASWYAGNMRHYANTGEIIVTSSSSQSVTGTFTFAADSISITGGTFTVALQ